MLNQIYNGDDRVKQVNWLRGEIEIIVSGGEGTALELVDFWYQHLEGQGELPKWFDDADKSLLVQFIEER